MKEIWVFIGPKGRIFVCHRTGNISENDYNEHRKKKDETREEKEKDKASGESIAFTMDLQSVLLCPKSNVSSLYYKTKLSVHNLTIYILNTKSVSCYVWNEAEGGLTANEFSSIVCDFIVKEIPLTNLKNFIVYNDGWGYQNRNAVLSNAQRITEFSKIA